MPASAPSAAALARAAKVVAETGVVICIEARDGTLYRLTPPGAPSPIGATEREADECDKAFGVGSSG